MRPMRKDELMTTVFGQLELVSDLAVKAGDAELAQELNVLFAKSLERYCEGKRARLSERLDAENRSAA